MNKKIFTIVLTGGPSSGKTSAMPHIKERLEGLGFNVFVVPEAATMMILGGVSLLDGNVLNKQHELLSLQKRLEETFTSIAWYSDKPSVVLCDRGVLDNKAFISQEMWNQLIYEAGDTLVELRDKRYDAVIHMVSAAVGAQEFYTLDNNLARSESIEQAAILDQKIQDAWVGHPHLRIVDNQVDFKEKLRRVTAVVCNVVGVPEPIERERKFLVSSVKFPTSLKRVTVDIEQTYLTSTSGSARVRKRGQDGSFTYTHTIKHKIGSGKNIEEEDMITERTYMDLLKTGDPNREVIRKQRTCFLWNNQYFELDCFLSARVGLLLLEAEIETDDAEVLLPPFITIDKEVTDDHSYSNSEIAKIQDPKFTEYVSKLQ